MDLASSLAVIGWFVQVLFDKGFTFAIDYWGGAGAGPDLPAALERLREAINCVGALLPIARKIRSENEGLLEYVTRLKDAAYDAEDILSELGYYRLQKVVEGNDDSNNSSSVSSMVDAAGRAFSQLRLTNEDTQELDCFIIEEGRKIGELKNLKQLGGSLSLESLENVYTKEEALEAELSKKMHIRNLRLKWKNSYTLPEVAEEVFEGIRPPAYVNKLFIDGYGGVNTPTWMMSFSNLESLFLLNCLKWKDLPPLVELPALRHLTICKADAVEVIGRGFYGTGVARGFSRLETLEFICMPQLVTWSGIGEDSDFLFPRLDKLLIADCPKLEQVPVKDLTSLKKIILNSCNWLHLLPLLPAMLEVLVLHNLELLTDLTMEKLSDLTSLRKLYIKRCSFLNSLPLLPASLKFLEVNECPELPQERYQEGGEDWNNVSHIPRMKWYQEGARMRMRMQVWARVPARAQVRAKARTQERLLALAPVPAREWEWEREWMLEQEREWEREWERVQLLV